MRPLQQPDRLLALPAPQRHLALLVGQEQHPVGVADPRVDLPGGGEVGDGARQIARLRLQQPLELQGRGPQPVLLEAGAEGLRGVHRPVELARRLLVPPRLPQRPGQLAPHPHHRRRGTPYGRRPPPRCGRRPGPRRGAGGPGSASTAVRTAPTRPRTAPRRRPAARSRTAPPGSAPATAGRVPCPRRGGRRGRPRRGPAAGRRSSGARRRYGPHAPPAAGTSGPARRAPGRARRPPGRPGRAAARRGRAAGRASASRRQVGTAGFGQPPLRQ